MKLYLIRHGLTQANEQRLYCGATDLPLSQAGREGIRAHIAQGLYPSAAGLVLYTSGLLRAKQTLGEIYGSVPHQVLPGMAEMHFGIFEMHSYEQLKQDADYQSWIADTSGQTACPGGESAQAFFLRVLAAFGSLCALDQDALVVSHGGVIARLMAHLFPEEPRHFYQWQPKAGEGYVLFRQRTDPAQWAYRALANTEA